MWFEGARCLMVREERRIAVVPLVLLLPADSQPAARAARKWTWRRDDMSKVTNRSHE